MGFEFQPFWDDLSTFARVVFIIVVALAARLLIQGVRRGLDRVIAPAHVAGGDTHARAVRASPRLATVNSLLSSTFTLAVLFFAIGLVLRELGVELSDYLATATVIGLAVGFGSQGLVQDIVIGLTLIFTDALDIGDTVEIAGQTGRVEHVGLRFTVITNFLGQTVYVPNRNIGTVGRFRHGVIRAYLDAQLSDSVAEADMLAAIADTARAFREQFHGVLLSDPELGSVRSTGDGGWRFVRIKFRLWPGQGALIETAFRQRLLARLKRLDPDYADWMLTVTYRASAPAAAARATATGA